MEVLEMDRKGIITQFQSSLEQKRDHPDDPNDPYIPLFSQAFLNLTDDRTVQNELINIRKAPTREADSVDHIVNIVMREINTTRLGFSSDGTIFLADTTYPTSRDTVESWEDLLRQSLIDHTGNYQYDVYYRSVQSNVYQRYMILKFLGIMGKERFGPTPTFLDLGCSQNMGLKWLARSNETETFPIDEIRVLNSDYNNPDMTKYSINQEATEVLNTNYILPKFTPGPSRGVDLWPINDIGNKLWVAGCSSYPGEFRDQTRMGRLAELSKEVPGVSYSDYIDCSNLEDLKKGIPEDEKFNVVFMSMMLYQNTPDKIAKIISNAKRYAKDYVVIFDVADRDPSSPNNLKVAKKLYSPDRPFGFKVLAYDIEDKKRGFQETFRFKNGRINDVIPNLGNKAVAAALLV